MSWPKKTQGKSSYNRCGGKTRLVRQYYEAQANADTSVFQIHAGLAERTNSGSCDIATEVGIQMSDGECILLILLHDHYEVSITTSELKRTDRHHGRTHVYSLRIISMSFTSSVAKCRVSLIIVSSGLGVMAGDIEERRSDSHNLSLLGWVMSRSSLLAVLRPVNPLTNSIRDQKHCQFIINPFSSYFWTSPSTILSFFAGG